jgi:HPr kinase/phosphorylase
MAHGSATLHASAVLIGPSAVLIRGASGSGKSHLVFDLIQAGACGQLPFVRLVGDDRVHCTAVHGRLLVRPAEGLEGLLELRGVGLLRLAYEPVAQVGLVVDLGATAPPRMPDRRDIEAEIDGVQLPRLAVATGQDPLRLVLAQARCEPALEIEIPSTLAVPRAGSRNHQG